MLWTWGMRALSGGAAFAGIAVGLLFLFQEKLLYVPKLPGVPEHDDRLVPDRWGFDSEDVWFTAADGTKLHGWFLTLRGWSRDFVKSRPVILFFQENAGNMSHRLPFLKLMAQRLQVPIFAASYRGYFLSDAKPPNQKGIQMDAQAALECLQSRTDIDSSRIVLFGRSLGGAVAIHLAAANKQKVAGLMVENTFTSIMDMVPRILPPLGLLIGTGKPLNFLVTNKWHNIEEITKLSGIPMLLLGSRQDEMVPFSQMQALHQAAPSQWCSWEEFPDSTHMDAYDANAELYWPALRSFFATKLQDSLHSSAQQEQPAEMRHSQ